MSITSIGSLGTATVKTSGTTLTVSPSRNVSAGRVVVLWWGWDGGRALGETFGNYFPRWACYDTAGNHWLSLVSRAEDFGHPAGGLHMSRLRSGLQTTDTITVECQITNRVQKALSMWEFSLTDSDTRIAVVDNVGNDARLSDPQGISLPTLPEREYLLLHMLASQGPSTDAFTLDSDYTAITQAGTTGGSDDSNVTITGGFRIATLTTDSLDVSSDTADRDYMQAVVALTEAPYDDSFPTQPVWDDFNRADENPVDGGKWITDSNNIPTFTNRMQIVSNRATGTSGGHGGQWADETVTSNNAEVYATFPELDGGGQGVELIMHGAGSGSLGTRSGYSCEWRPVTFGFTVKDRIDMGISGLISNVSEPFVRVWIDQADGSKMGMQRLNAFHHLWVDIGSGWEWLAAWWVYESLPAYNIYATSGLAGGILLDGTNTMDDFGYGGIATEFIPQIIRRLPF